MDLNKPYGEEVLSRVRATWLEKEANWVEPYTEFLSRTPSSSRPSLMMVLMMLMMLRERKMKVRFMCRRCDILFDLFTL